LVRKKDNKALLASVLSNVSEYYFRSKDYIKAKELCKEALSIFEKEMGRDNKYSRACLINHFRILTLLNNNEELENMRKLWSNPTPLVNPEPLNDQEMKDLQELFKKFFTYRKALEPLGLTKGKNFYKYELAHFF